METFVKGSIMCPKPENYMHQPQYLRLILFAVTNQPRRWSSRQIGIEFTFLYKSIYGIGFL